MNNSIVIIGAGGHGRVVADAAALCGYKEILFLDDADKYGDRVSGKVADYIKYVDKADFFVAIGDNSVREQITCEILKGGANVVSVIHPSAVIGSNVCIGNGTFIAPGVVINAGAKLGCGVIMNTCCSADHDCVIEDYSHVAVGGHLAGTVCIGKGTFVGSGATVINNISVCDGCIIGAGAVVVRNILESGTYVGVPAVKIKD